MIRPATRPTRTVKQEPHRYKQVDDGDGDEGEMQRFSKRGLWEKSSKLALATTASLIGKRETSWRPVSPMRTIGDARLAIAHGRTMGLRPTSPIIVVVAPISPGGQNT